MPAGGVGSWSPSSLINTLGHSTHTHMQATRSSVNQSAIQPVSQSVSRSRALVPFNPNHNTTRCNTTCFLLAVCRAVTTFFLSRV